MIKNLKKNLIILFISSVMLIFTLVFCILIQGNIDSKKRSDTDFFNRIATCLLFTLENSSDYEKDLKSVEQNYHMYLQYLDSNQNVLYQNSNIFKEDTTDVMENFTAEINKTTVYSLESITSSSTSGSFVFLSHTGISYIGMQCNVITNNGTQYTLYIIRDFSSSWEIVKQRLPSYCLIWLLVLAAILFLAYFIIGKAVKPTEVAIHSQKEFIASVSHELKSPLAVILSSAEVIATYEDLPDNMKNQTKIIDSECLRMSKLIQDLLLLSSIDAKTWTLQRTEIDIDSLMINLYEKFEPLCSRHNLFLNLDIEERTFPPFQADIDRINQLLGIFIDNAINYSSPNTEILLKVIFLKNNFVFSIIDHGQGIFDQDKPFIFDRFYCADKSRTRKEHFGLGLSIAKELITMHKGTITLTDTLGGGCTFQIFIPFTNIIVITD